MKSATVAQLKRELKTHPSEELIEICLRLTKFKKENKELLTYLLYEESDEDAYIRNVKEEIDTQFKQINRASYYYIKKSIRKILSNVKKHVRYSKKKTTEIELLIYFLSKLKNVRPSYTRNIMLVNLYERQYALIEKAYNSLEDDLKLDYKDLIEDL